MLTRLFLAVSLLLPVSLSGNFENVSVRPVVIRDAEVPGLPGVTVDPDFNDAWFLGEGGHVVGPTRLRGEGVESSNDRGVILIDPDGTLSLVIREGDPIGSGTFIREQFPAVSSGGRIASQVDVMGDSFIRSIVSGSGEGLTPVLSSFDPAPDGFDPGAKIDIFGISNFSMNSSGTFAFLSTVNSSPTVEGSRRANVIFTSNGGAPVPTVRTDVNYPGLPPQVQGEEESVFVLETFGNPIIQESGDLIFVAAARDPAQGGAQFRGLWKFSGGAVTEMARGGMAAPGLEGLTISALGGPGLLTAAGGKAVMTALLQGEGLTSENNQAFWIGDESGFTLIAREGDPAPVLPGAPAGNFSQGLDVTLAENGTALINSVGLLVWNGSLEPLITIGGEVAGVPGNNWERIYTSAINPNGLIAVHARHRGDAGLKDAIWVSDNGGPLQELIYPTTVLLPDGSDLNASGRDLISGKRGFNGRNELLIEYQFATAAVISLDGQLDLGSIEGRVEIDQNGDGNPDEKGSGLEGVTVRLIRSDDGEGIGETITAGGGYYRFSDIPADNYVVSIESLPGYQSTGDSDDTLEAITAGTIAVGLGTDQDMRDLDFLEWKLPGEGVLSGFVLEDPNGDGDAGDAVAGIRGAEVLLNDAITRNRVGPIVSTDENGAFLFSEIPPGDYNVVVSLDNVVGTESATFTERRFRSLQRHEFKRVSMPVENPVRFLAAKSSYVRGRVSDGEDPATGIANARVKLTYPDGTPVTFHGSNPVLTGANGVFEFLTYPGDYILEALDPPGYRSTDDSEGSPTDNRISLTVTSGQNSEDHSFVDSKKNYSISMHRLSEIGVLNLNAPLENDRSSFSRIEPLRPVNEWAVLDAQPRVTDGLVADGVTPLLIKFCSTDPVSDSLGLQWIVEEVSGGVISGGILSHMQRWINGDWEPAELNFNQATLTQVDPCGFALISALDPAKLIFEPGSDEIELSFKLLSEGENPALLDKQRIVIRRPPLLLQSRQKWSESFIEIVSMHLPEDFLRITASSATPDALNFYFQRIRESWAVNRMDVVAQGFGGFELARLLERENFRGIHDLYRGKVRRAVFIGMPHRGTRLEAYLTELETRLKLSGLNASLPRVFPAGSNRPFSWNDFVDDSRPSASLIPKTLDPRSDLFTREVLYDPSTAVFHIVTNIDGDNSRAYRKVGLKGDILSAVFPNGSDGLVDVLSAGAVTRASDFNNAVNVHRFEATEPGISHGEPSELFGADETQTTSSAVATKVMEVLQDLNDLNFFPYAKPTPLSAAEFESIFEAAQDVLLADVVDLEQVLVGEVSSQVATQRLPMKQADGEEDRVFRFEFDASDVEDVFWAAEVYGPDGVLQEGVSVELSDNDPTSVTVSVSSAVVGDVVLFMSYVRADDTLAVGRPRWVTYQPPRTGELTNLELLPDDASFQVGDSFVPEVVAVYSDGTRVTRWLDPLSLGAVDASDPGALSVENFPRVHALKAGQSTLTVEAFGFIAEADITVEAEPADLDYTTWKAQYFTAEELGDPDISGDAVDLDGDSLNLFLEFITGGHPWVSNNNFLPRIQKLDSGLGGQDVVGFRVSTQLEGEQVFAEYSTDLEVWSELLELSELTNLNQSTIVDYVQGDGYLEIILQRDQAKASFYRLSVQSEEP